MELKEIENKIGQLQYEISCLGLDKEELTGVSIRTEELKELVEKLTIPVVSQRSELLKVEDKDVSFDFYLDRFFEEPKIQLTYKNKRTKKYLLESKIISDYKRAMCL